jgi:DNA-3-methyladenine glycosylase
MTRSQRAATLPVSFFRRPTEQVARELLGAVVVSRMDGVVTAGRIVEVEAYLGHRDPASHGYRHRRHPQNETLHGPAGRWYVYRSYGVHWCANLVCERERNAGAVLLRALEPVEGLPQMRARRGAVTDRLLCAGPGRLTQALGISRALDGAAATEADVVVLRGEPPETIAATPRIGITQAVEWPLRFVVPGSPWLSRRGVIRSLRSPSQC